jgi:hypothetical protein
MLWHNQQQKHWENIAKEKKRPWKLCKNCKSSKTDTTNLGGTAKLTWQSMREWTQWYVASSSMKEDEVA